MSISRKVSGSYIQIRDPDTRYYSSIRKTTSTGFTFLDRTTMYSDRWSTECWYKSTVTTPSIYMGLFGCWGGGTGDWLIAADQNGGNMSFFSRDYNDTYPLVSNIVSTSEWLNQQWNHIAFAWDRGRVQLWFNGIRRMGNSGYNTGYSSVIGNSEECHIGSSGVRASAPGYYTDCRWVKDGTAYSISGDITPPVRPLRPTDPINSGTVIGLIGGWKDSNIPTDTQEPQDRGHLFNRMRTGSFFFNTQYPDAYIEPQPSLPNVRFQVLGGGGGTDDERVLGGAQGGAGAGAFWDEEITGLAGKTVNITIGQGGGVGDRGDPSKVTTSDGKLNLEAEGGGSSGTGGCGAGNGGGLGSNGGGSPARWPAHGNSGGKAGGNAVTGCSGGGGGIGAPGTGGNDGNPGGGGSGKAFIDGVRRGGGGGGSSSFSIAYGADGGGRGATPGSTAGRGADGYGAGAGGGSPNGTTGVFGNVGGSGTVLVQADDISVQSTSGQVTVLNNYNPPIYRFYGNGTITFKPE